MFRGAVPEVVFGTAPAWFCGKMRGRLPPGGDVEADAQAGLQFRVGGVIPGNKARGGARTRGGNQKAVVGNRAAHPLGNQVCQIHRVETAGSGSHEPAIRHTGVIIPARVEPGVVPGGGEFFPGRGHPVQVKGLPVAAVIGVDVEDCAGDDSIGGDAGEVKPDQTE